MKIEINIILQIVKNIMKGLINLVGHLFKMVYLIIQWFNNLIAKLFLKMPRLLRVVIVYLLIASLIFSIMVLTKNIKVSF